MTKPNWPAVLFSSSLFAAISYTFTRLSIAIPLFALYYLWILAPAGLIAIGWQGVWLTRDFYGIAGGGLATGLLVMILGMSRIGALGAARRVSRQSLAVVAALFTLAWCTTMLFRPPSEAAKSRPMGLAFGLVTMFIVAWCVGEVRHRSSYLNTLCALGAGLALLETWRIYKGGSIHAETVALGFNPIDLGRVCAYGAYAGVMSAGTAGRRISSPLTASLLLGSLVALIGTIASGSRGPIAGVVLALLWATLRTRRLGPLSRILVLAGSTAAIGWAAELASVGSIVRGDGLRRTAWGLALKAGLDQPLIGTGMGHFADGTPWEYSLANSHPHNVFLETFGELGLIAFLLLLLLLGFAWRVGDATGRGLLIVSCVCVLVSGNLGQSHLLWASVGLCFSSPVSGSNSADPMTGVPSKNLRIARTRLGRR